MEINGHTRMYCLIGSPVGHSGSPAMYNYSFQKFDMDCVYLAYDVKLEDTKQAIDALRLFHAGGFNITMPCKTEALQCCDELSKAAELIGAVNTVVNEKGRLIGHNTDGMGWVRNCREHGFDITGKKMTICGGGGAATAIQIACALEGCREMAIFVRTSGKSYANAQLTAEKIRLHVPECKVQVLDLEDRELFYREIADSDIFTNATNVGMKPLENQTLIEDMHAFRPDLVVCDIVYNPRVTRLLEDAKAHGCRTISGLGMLLWQGAEAFRLYTGKEMPVAEIQERYFAE